MLNEKVTERKQTKVTEIKRLQVVFYLVFLSVLLIFHPLSCVVQSRASEAVRATGVVAGFKCGGVGGVHSWWWNTQSQTH